MSEITKIKGTTRLMEDIAQGLAPWQVEWSSNKLIMPQNGVSGKPYNGLNGMNLLNIRSNSKDPRWFTYNQLSELGLKVREGEKPMPVRYTKFTDTIVVTDENGVVQKDEDGEVKYARKELENPQVVFYSVFNATQLEGDLAPFQQQERGEAAQYSKVTELAEQLQKSVNTDAFDLSAVKQNLQDLQGLPSYYHNFLLYEIGYSAQFLNKNPEEVKELQQDRGSVNEAKEIIVASITSFLLAQELNLDYIPHEHKFGKKTWDWDKTASWAEKHANIDNCYELYGMVAEAEKRKQQILSLGLTLEMEAVQKDVPEQQQEQQLAEVKTFLSVPFTQKDQVKNLGAKWDKDAKLWFVPEGTDLNPLNNWLPEQGIELPVNRNRSLFPAEEAALTINEIGGDLKGMLPIMDGKIHRLPRLDALTSHDTSVSYCICSNRSGNPVGWVENFATEDKAYWHYSSGHELSEEQKQTLKTQTKQEKLQREQERKALANKKAELCTKHFLASEPANKKHPYLQTKGVEPFGIIQNSNKTNITIPLINIDGEIRNFQYINGEGQKSFEAGAEKKGNFHLIGATLEDLKKNQPEILIAEGYATGASLHMATGKPVVVAFDSNNLLPVAKNIRGALPEASLIFCAVPRFVNASIKTVEQAAAKIQGKVITPELSVKDKENGLTGFNDIHKNHGLRTLKKQIEQSLKKAKVQTLEKTQSKGFGR